MNELKGNFSIFITFFKYFNKKNVISSTDPNFVTVQLLKKMKKAHSNTSGKRHKL